MVGDVTAVTSLSAGPVVSIVKELTDSVVLVLLALSVTDIVQLLYVPSANSLKVIVLFPTDADVVELLQLPP